jgi:hypothetical protein
MIKFELRCADGHGFEGWFRDGATYDAQAAGHEVACPVCGSTDVSKALMAPRIAKGGPSPEEIRAAKAQVVEKLREMRKEIEANAEYVGPSFAEEARRIHYGETETKAIYGEASDTEAEALRDEGIDFARIPWLPPTN